MGRGPGRHAGRGSPSSPCLGTKRGSGGGSPWERSGGAGAASPGKEAGVRGRQPLGKKRGSGGGSPWERSGVAGGGSPKSLNLDRVLKFALIATYSYCY